MKHDEWEEAECSIFDYRMRAHLRAEGWEPYAVSSGLVFYRRRRE